MATVVEKSGKLLCPNLVTMLTKTIRALCEVNVTYDQRLEISGCLHIRSDGHPVVACLIDELFHRPDADECRRSEDVTKRHAPNESYRSSSHVKLENSSTTDDNVDEYGELVSGDDASDCSKSSLDGNAVHARPQYGIMNSKRRAAATKLADFADFVQMDFNSEEYAGGNHVDANSENNVNNDSIAKDKWPSVTPTHVKNEPVESWHIPAVRTTPYSNQVEPVVNYNAMVTTTPLCSEVVDNGGDGGGAAKKKKFQCMLCGIYLSAKCYLKNHINAVHTKARAYPCDLCKKLFYSAGAVRIHKLRNHWHGAKKHRCRHCGELFLLPVELRKHVYKAHGEAPIEHSRVPLQDGQPHLPAAPDQTDGPDISFNFVVTNNNIAASQAVFP